LEEAEGLGCDPGAAVSLRLDQHGVPVNDVGIGGHPCVAFGLLGLSGGEAALGAGNSPVKLTGSAWRHLVGAV
jgi:hypothetical protein